MFYVIIYLWVTGFLGILLTQAMTLGAEDYRQIFRVDMWDWLSLIGMAVWPLSVPFLLLHILYDYLVYGRE